MTNEKILYEIEQIDNIVNELDRILAYQKFNKQYIKSDFYKQTKMPLEKLCATLAHFKTQRLVVTILQNFSVENLSNNLSEIIEGIDTPTIQLFFNRLGESLDPTALSSSAQILQQQMDKLQRK